MRFVSYPFVSFPHLEVKSEKLGFGTRGMEWCSAFRFAGWEGEGEKPQTIITAMWGREAGFVDIVFRLWAWPLDWKILL